MGSGKGAGTGCLKILLIFFNILFWVSNFQSLGFCYNTVSFFVLMWNNTVLLNESEKFVYFSGVAGWSHIQLDGMSSEIVYYVLIDRLEYRCSGSNETSDVFYYLFWNTLDRKRWVFCCFGWTGSNLGWQYCSDASSKNIVDKWS